ncbi:hypothetical protein FRB95_003853 [Tulasnella sp. JGI-2019a]|nr:hypothetical protein FRB95_003853 [Tulasnella sp. JGI-2019a]
MKPFGRESPGKMPHAKRTVRETHEWLLGFTVRTTVASLLLPPLEALCFNHPMRRGVINFHGRLRRYRLDHISTIIVRTFMDYVRFRTTPVTSRYSRLDNGKWNYCAIVAVPRGPSDEPMLGHS